jgi:hypothetical protein
MRTFKIDRLTDGEIESLLQEYKVRYEKEVDNILETRSPNDYVLDEIYQIICVLSEIQDTRAALRKIAYRFYLTDPVDTVTILRDTAVEALEDE